MYHAGYMTLNPMWFMVDYCSAFSAFICGYLFPAHKKGRLQLRWITGPLKRLLIIRHHFLPVSLHLIFIYSVASAAQHPVPAVPQQALGASSTQHGFGQGIGQGLSQTPSAPSPAQHGFGQTSVHGVLAQPVDSACIAAIWGHDAILPIAGQHPSFAGVCVSAG